MVSISVVAISFVFFLLSSHRILSLNLWWVLDGLVRHVWELNLMLSPHCEVYPHEVKEETLRKGGKSLI